MGGLVLEPLEHRPPLGIAVPAVIDGEERDEVPLTA